MPSYRGVSQADLIRSINDALELLETHSTGPVLQKRIDDLRAPDASGQSKLGAIAAAQDDVSLVSAVRGSGVMWLFARAHKVLKFHARNNTDGKGYDIVSRLVSWGAMSGAMTMEYNAFDREFDAFLQKQSLKNGFNKLRSALGGKGAMESSGPLSRYGVVLEDLTSGKIDWHHPSIETIRKKVDQVLAPFYPLDEVEMTAIGLIDHFPQKGAPRGIIFISSARAAQAVADALPDMKVIDAEG